MEASKDIRAAGIPAVTFVNVHVGYPGERGEIAVDSNAVSVRANMLPSPAHSIPLIRLIEPLPPLPPSTSALTSCHLSTSLCPSLHFPLSFLSTRPFSQVFEAGDASSRHEGYAGVFEKVRYVALHASPTYS